MKPPPINKSVGDAAHEISKAVLSVVPVAGGPLVALFENIFTAPLNKRKQEWFEELAGVVTKNEAGVGKSLRKVFFYNLVGQLQLTPIGGRRGVNRKINFLALVMTKKYLHAHTHGDVLMKIKHYGIIGIITLLIPNFVNAGAGWTDSVNVGELITASGDYYVVKLPVTKNPSGCRNKTMFYQDYESPGSNKMFNTLLQAMESDISLRVQVTGGCNIDGYSEISAVGVSK